MHLFRKPLLAVADQARVERFVRDRSEPDAAERAELSARFARLLAERDGQGVVRFFDEVNRRNAASRPRREDVAEVEARIVSPSTIELARPAPPGGWSGVERVRLTLYLRAELVDSREGPRRGGIIDREWLERAASVIPAAGGQAKPYRPGTPIQAGVTLVLDLAANGGEP